MSVLFSETRLRMVSLTRLGLLIRCRIRDHLDQTKTSVVTRRSDVERPLVLLLIAGALGAYCVWQALSAIAMLPSLTSPRLLLAFALQAVLAILAAIGVYRQQSWAGAALLWLGASIAAT